ncbi:aspartate-semialdehyde dehydrogenase, NAD(P)-binding [uncultured Desulfobacterium sp.]|uniref:Aspartate-semialdehyde dehydrogenase n=1 Tax=uncultured Desulfobacterium sp. TaxID=201089 RepID=A0A445N0X6_9BACT|nr:aspartate-semialdehyde dehydrogenase, NAD(P)-binding [uncultured Desulfobacterium sp.]
MLRVGLVGWRGMVGSVLMSRMVDEKDFRGFEPTFFTTSNVGGKGPNIGLDIPPLRDAFDIDSLFSQEIIVTCQGGDYTKKVYPQLRNAGWDGYWIDSASALRMSDESIIVLDPVNRSVIDFGLSAGTKTFVGGNCTVSLMLMALSGLFASGHIEWISSMTYQAASGAGAKHMKELISQMAVIGEVSKPLLNDPASTAIELDDIVTKKMRGLAFPVENFLAPLAGSLIPWIDTAMESGQTREEWKGGVEANKILQTEKPIPVDGLCVRVGSMRCHSQALTIKLNKDVPLDEIADMISKGNEWVNLVPNNKEATLKSLTPAAVNGTLTVPIGRLRKMLMGPEFVTAFTVGDQLLWGAAEPIRRILRIIVERLT